MKSASASSSSRSTSSIAQLAGGRVGHVGVVGDDLHAEGGGPGGHEPADLAEADDAERLVGQLDALPLRALPAPVDQRGVGLGDVAGLGQQHGHGVLGGGEDVRLRRVDHHHARAGWPPSTSTLSSPMPARPTTTRSAPAASTSAVTWVAERMMSACGAGDGREQLGGGQARGARRPRGRRARSSIEAGLGDLLGDQDASHAVLQRRGRARRPLHPAQRPATAPDDRGRGHARRLG